MCRLREKSQNFEKRRKAGERLVFTILLTKPFQMEVELTNAFARIQVMASETKMFDRHVTDVKISFVFGAIQMRL